MSTFNSSNYTNYTVYADGTYEYDDDFLSYGEYMDMLSKQMAKVSESINSILRGNSKDQLGPLLDRLSRIQKAKKQLIGIYEEYKNNEDFDD